jgi:drug/metabolite transporter (DMT)-like permease
LSIAFVLDENPSVASVGSGSARAFESLGLLMMPCALAYAPAVTVAPLTASLPLWVVVASKLILNDVERITPRIIAGALLVVLGTIAISLAKV